MERGAARFELDATQQRAAQGDLFVLEPESVHTGMAAVPEGWAYKVLYVEPTLVHEWAERDTAPPRAARWVVFRDLALHRAGFARAERKIAASDMRQAAGDHRIAEGIGVQGLRAARQAIPRDAA